MSRAVLPGGRGGPGSGSRRAGRSRSRRTAAAVDVAARLERGEGRQQEHRDVGRGPQHEPGAQPGPASHGGVDAECDDAQREILDRDEGDQRPRHGPPVPSLPDRRVRADQAGDGEVDRLVVLQPGVLESGVEEVGGEDEPRLERGKRSPCHAEEQERRGCEGQGLDEGKEVRAEERAEEGFERGEQHVHERGVLAEEVHPPHRDERRLEVRERVQALGEDREVEVERVVVGEAVVVDPAVREGGGQDQPERRAVRPRRPSRRGSRLQEASSSARGKCPRRAAERS